jgi:serine/threonine protein kinase
MPPPNLPFSQPNAPNVTGATWHGLGSKGRPRSAKIRAMLVLVLDQQVCSIIVSPGVAAERRGVSLVADFGGRYRRDNLLGAGGMGEVWLALDEQLGDRPVAIKVMHTRMLASSEDVARFQREMRLASRMQHPNIMTVFTTGTDNGVPFMVMEYLQGRDLSKVPPNRDSDHVARIGRDTCAALAYAHGQGVVHRDIKPGNLFLCDTGVVKVTDFGIAKAISGTKLSATGTLIGTFPYMAPEQWLGEPAAFSNDIWAVGCVLYELLSGRLPREYTTPREYAAAAARREPVPPLPVGTSGPAWLANAVMAMLQTDPRSRPTADQCVQMLSKPPEQSRPQPAPRPARSPHPNQFSHPPQPAPRPVPLTPQFIPPPVVQRSTPAVVPGRRPAPGLVVRPRRRHAAISAIGVIVAAVAMALAIGWVWGIVVLIEKQVAAGGAHSAAPYGLFALLIGIAGLPILCMIGVTAFSQFR